jgi:hypothetical protein
MFRCFFALAACGLLVGCDSGLITGEDEVDPEFESVQPGPAPIRRLTRTEYNNTLRDLLGDFSRPGNVFPPDEESLGFDNNANALNVTPLLAEQYMKVAEDVSVSTALETILPCAPERPEDEEPCARSFIETFGRRAYRRPLTDEQTQKLLEVYSFGAEESDFENGIRLAFQAILQSPFFIYRVEYGELPSHPDQRMTRVTGYEMASRLSYMLWNSMPDDELFAAAEEGRLQTPEEVAEQARRMLDDPKARDMVGNFYRQWLMLEGVDALQKDSETYPDFSPEIAAALRAETEAFLDYIVWEDDRDFTAIFTSSLSFRNGALSTFYGEEGPTGEQLEPVELDPAKRAGILSQGSIMSVHSKSNQSSPIHRGKFVREQIFCHNLPAQPDDIPVVAPDLDPTLTTRERFAAHREDPVCAGCHGLMDPIGFGFENFDGVGRFRSEENGLAVDASGELTATDVDGPFNGAVELSAKLAESEEVQNCVVTQAFRFGYGRGESEDDLHTLETLRVGFGDSGRNLKELFVQMTQTEAFLYRPIAGGE